MFILIRIHTCKSLKKTQSFLCLAGRYAHRFEAADSRAGMGMARRGRARVPTLLRAVWWQWLARRDTVLWVDLLS